MKLNQRGSATVIVLTSIPIFLALICGFFVIRSWLLISFDLKQTCRDQTLELQQQNISSLKNLFLLNPVARALRIELIEAKAMLAAGIATENPPLILTAKNQIESVMLQKKKLDAAQRQIISSANLRTTLLSNLTLTRMRNAFQSYQRKFDFFINLNFYDGFQVIPALAVRPDIAGDLAPVYETQKEFLRKQMASTSWNVSISSHGKWLSNWLKVDSQQNYSCQASIKEEVSGWKLNIEKF